VKLGIDKNSPAVYKQIETSLRKRIRDGHWVAGTMLPSRRDLAKEFGVSSVTVERAITRLIADGILRADDRRGTFVTETPAGAQIHLNAGSRSQDRNAPPTVWPVKPATIGIVASLYLFRHDHLELNNFWVRLIVQSLEHSFSADGQTTRFFNRVADGQGPQEPLSKTLECALGSDVDALVVIAFGMNAGEVDESLGLLGTQERPVVCITSGALSRPVPHIFYNNHFAGYQAAQHLIREGVDRVIYFSPFSSAWAGERKNGAREAMIHAGLPTDALTSYPENPGPWIQEEDPLTLGYQAAMNMFQGDWRGEGRPGVICANDGVAFGFLQAANENGLRQGSDFSVVSFDDHPQSRAQHLTTLRPPMEQMGQEAARVLLAALHGEEASLQVCLRWHLIPRSGFDSQS
jgi:DNA-binding LacI/PurR family transcriptional regulator